MSYTCVSVDLLGSTGNFVDKLLDVDEATCLQWSKPDFIQSVLEAAKQVGYVDKYGITPNKRPWAFANLADLTRAFHLSVAIYGMKNGPSFAKI